ncbi:hypothetical protein [Archaeoglobus sp.]
MSEPTRDLLWGVEEFQVTLHYIAFIVAGVIFLVGIYRVYRIIRQAGEMRTGIKAVGADKLMVVMDVIELIYQSVYGEE